MIVAAEDGIGNGDADNSGDNGLLSIDNVPKSLLGHLHVPVLCVPLIPLTLYFHLTGFIPPCSRLLISLKLSYHACFLVFGATAK